MKIVSILLVSIFTLGCSQSYTQDNDDVFGTTEFYPTPYPTPWQMHPRNTPQPTSDATASGTRPTRRPTPRPTINVNPTQYPTPSPTRRPTRYPTRYPTLRPTMYPSLSHITYAPTPAPTSEVSTLAAKYYLFGSEVSLADMMVVAATIWGAIAVLGLTYFYRHSLFEDKNAVAAVRLDPDMSIHSSISDTSHHSGSISVSQR